MSLPTTFLLRAPQLPPLSPKLSHAAENIDSILNDKIVSNKDGGICLSGEEDLNQKIHGLLWWIPIDPDLLEYYHSQQQLPNPHSTGSSFSHPGGNDEGITPFEGICTRRWHVVFL